MAHVALPDHNAHRTNRGEQEKELEAISSATHANPFAGPQGARATGRLVALGEMTMGIVHDFRNLLAVIDSGLRLAEKSSGEPEKVRTCIAAAREGINRGAGLATQLLTFARQRHFEALPGDANELLRNLELFLTYGAGPRNRVVLKLAADIPKCMLDSSQFNAAVVNLIVNARDAMPNGGEIQISTERWVVETATSGSPVPGTYVRVRVKDNGQGMPAEVVRRIFDTFFTTKGEEGTGLGLPQVYAFMRLIGGHVGVTSEPGIGTTFDLLFPAANQTESSQSPKPKADLGHRPLMVTGSHQR